MRSFSDMWYDPVARKKILIFGGAGLAFIIILIIIIVVATSGSKPDNFVGSQVLGEVPLIDGHNDLPYNLLKLEQNKLKDFDFNNLTAVDKWKNANETRSHTDLLRLMDGKVRGQFWSAYIECLAQNAVSKTLDQIDVIKRLVAQNSEKMELVTESEGIRNAFYHNKVGSLIGVEGGHLIDNSLAVLRLYYQLGVRYMTLTHDCNTDWAEFHASSDSSTPKVSGLNDFGKNVVREMNRLGMIVDISHVSKKTMSDVLDTSVPPVIFSHSSAAAVTQNTKNVDDEILTKLKAKNGLIMVNFGSEFVRRGTDATVKATMDDVIEHLDHIRNVTGSSKFVGIGANYDGVLEVPDGLEDVSKYPSLFDKLALTWEGHRGWTQEELQDLAGANFLRLMAAVEKYRDEHKDDPIIESLITDPITTTTTTTTTTAPPAAPASVPTAVPASG